MALAFPNDAHGRRNRIALIGIDGLRLELARYSYGAQGHMTAADCAFGTGASPLLFLSGRMRMRGSHATNSAAAR